MNRPSSSTSTSEHRSNPSRGFGFAPLLAIAGWALAGLAVIELLISIAIGYPSDPRVRPSRLQAFFEYGRSTESALRRMTRADPSRGAPITLSGWYDPLLATWPTKAKGLTMQAGNGHPVVTIYGGSHSVRLAEALGRTSHTLTPRSIGGPGATSNWSYGAFLRDRDGAKMSKAVVLTFNTNIVPAITSFSPAMWNNDSPMPYTADRFYLQNGSLRVIHPPYDSFAAYQETLADTARWNAAVDFFARHDPLFDRWSFRSTMLERSALIRVARRAYNSQRHKEIERAVFEKGTFHSQAEAIQVARALIIEFAAQARAQGEIPVIYLVNDLGYSDSLFRALEPALNAANVPYISSHRFISPSDPNGYLPDSHFTDANDERLARALEAVIMRASGDAGGSAAMRTKTIR